MFLPRTFLGALLHYNYKAIERLDQGHLYPLGERRDKHVTVGARTSDLRPQDSLFTGYSEPLLGMRAAIQPDLYKAFLTNVKSEKILRFLYFHIKYTKFREL
jgi:hypothetical protein